MSSGVHVAVIMDGNGRWASRRGMARTAGHRAGGRVVRSIVEAAPDLGVRVLTLYAFSSDNWRRPEAEVRRLMALFAAALRRETATCVERGIRVSVIGRRDRLPGVLVKGITEAESATRHGSRLHLRVAVDYSAREVLQRAARLLPEAGGEMPAAIAAAQHEPAPVAPVDLLIRTGGEQRLSDFLLWESAYAELYFTPVLFPDFTPGDLATALEAFRGRERRFGGLAVTA